MGSVEGAAKKHRTRKNVQHAILKTLQVSGIAAVAVMAPKVLELLKYTKGYKSEHQRRIERSLETLEKGGLVRIVDGGRVEITQKGELLLRRLESKRSPAPTPRRWDKQWRIVIFDIPEKRRVARNQLRDMLKNIGFYQLQGSVWVYPYDSEDLVTLIKAEYTLGTEVVYLVTDYLEGDDFLRQHFRLP